MRVVAIIFGVLLLLPGLCFLGFGLMFLRGSTIFGITELVLGAGLTWGAVALLMAGGK